MGNTLMASIEALLLISNRPLALKEIAHVCGVEVEAVRQAYEELKQKYAPDAGGVVMVHAGETVQFMTSPSVASVVEQFVKTETVGELTRPQLEALTIIAYRGPVAKEELERLRGVNCTLVLRNLILRGLVESREDHTRLSTIYTVTVEFLRHLGIAHVQQLPDYETLSRDERIEQVLTPPERADGTGE